MSSTYLVALGSNRPHHIYGSPRRILSAAMEELSALGTVSARSPIIPSAPVGPSARRFANAVVVIETELDPPALLAGLQRMENEFGRKRWRRWGDRVLDLDIVLWSEGRWQSDGVEIPHIELRKRAFVLGPARAVGRDLRDPSTGLSIAQLYARLTKPRLAPR